MKKTICMIAAALLAAGALTACSEKKADAPNTADGTVQSDNSNQAESPESTAQSESAGQADGGTGDLKLEKLVVGASPAPHAQILEAARDILKEKGYDLVIKEYTDFVQPDLALESKDLDANYFQHAPYLEQFNKEKGTDLVSAGAIHYEPLGIYAGKTASLDQLPEGAEIAVPNDVSNEARALLLLEGNGLIELKEGAGLDATKNDIVKNDKKLKIVEIEAAQLPRSLGDVNVAVINGNYAIEAGLKVTDVLAMEDSKSIAASTYGNIVAVRAGDEKSAKTLALIEALTSDTVKQFIEKTYQGAVVPLF